VCLKTFQSLIRKTRKVISSINIKEMEKNFPNFDLGLSYLFPPDPDGKKQKKEEQRFAYLDDRELDDLVEGAQAKTTKYATKYAVNVFQGNFCI